VVVARQPHSEEAFAMASVLRTRIRAIPWALKEGRRFALAWLKREPPLHRAALEFARSHATPGDPASVLAALDRFAHEKRFLMNVGDEKGPLLENAVREAGSDCRILELGSFVGYSAILMARNLGSAGRLLSIDVSETSSRVSGEMTELAGLADRVEFLTGSSTDVIRTLLEPFDLIFLDHWKSLYQQDAQEILERALLRPGGTMIADNVGPLFGDNPYVSWMQARTDFESRYLKSHVEYGDIEDGVLISRFTGSSA
jgi:catechol O-methyltransferase